MKRLVSRKEQNRPDRKTGFGTGVALGALLLVALLGPLAPATALTLHVPSEYATITDGLAASVAGDTVLVACGVYAETDLIMTDGVVLRSEDGTADCVTVRAMWLGRGMTCDNLGPDTAVEGFTFADGVDVAAGAVFCNHSALTFRDCVFAHNYTGLDGAGFYCNQSSPLLERCLFVDNIADDGSGGGFCSRLADPVLRGCEFRDNRAGGWGGGFYASGSDNVPRLEKCVFRGNSADNGGAVAFKGTHPVMVDCEFVDNVARSGGGGLYLDFGAEAVLETSLIEANAAPKGKAGLVSGSSAVTLLCCDLDPTTLVGDGDIVHDDTGCGVANQPLTWGRVKRLFR